jgi:hypothetical protein
MIPQVRSETDKSAVGKVEQLPAQPRRGLDQVPQPRPGLADVGMILEALGHRSMR